MDDSKELIESIDNLTNRANNGSKKVDSINYAKEISDLFIEYNEKKDILTLNKFIDLLTSGNVKSLAPRGDVTSADILKKYIDDKTTVLQYCFDNKIDLSYKIEKIVANDLEFIKECLKNEKYSIIRSYANRDTFLKRIDGVSILELLIQRDEFKYGVVSNFDIPLIIDLFIQYNQIDRFVDLHENLLFNRTYDGKRIIEYLFEQNKVDKDLIKRIKNHPEIIDLIIKYNKLDLLSNISNEIMLSNYNESKTILEELFDSGYMLDNLKYDLVSKKLSNGKMVLDYVLDRNPNYSNITSLSFAINSEFEAIFNVLKERNRLDLLKDLSGKQYLKKLDGDKTLLEELLDAGKKDFSDISSFFKEDYLNIYNVLKKKNRLDVIDVIKEENCLIKIDGNKTLLEDLFENGGNVKRFYHSMPIKNKDILKIVVDHKKFELLQFFNSELMLEPYDINNAYIDVILDAYVNGETNFLYNPKMSTFSHLSFEQQAEYYVKYAKHGLIKALSTLEKKELLEEQDGKKFIEVLIEADKESLINTIISDRVREDYEIAIILKLHNIEQKEIKFESITRDFKDEYFKSFFGDYNNFERVEKYEELLEELKDEMSGPESDPGLVNIMLQTYRHYLYTTHDTREIEQLLSIKEEYPLFRFIKIEDGAYYNEMSNSLNMDDENISTFNHEIGHAIYHNLVNREQRKEDSLRFKELFDKLKGSKETFEKLKEYSKEFNETQERIKKFVEEEYTKKYDESITPAVRSWIEYYVSTNKKDKIVHYTLSGIDPEFLNNVFGEMYTVEEYLENDKRVKINEMVDSILRCEYGDFIAIGDYFDGIYEGRFKSEFLKDENGNVIKGAYGHGYSYYLNNPGAVLDEMIANYSAITKGKDPAKGLEILRYYMGDELVNLLEEYYNKEIINSNALDQSVELGGQNEGRYI